MDENKYKLKILNGCEFQIEIHTESNNTMLNAGLNKARNAYSYLSGNKGIKNFEMPEYFEMPENLLKILEIELKKEMRQIIASEEKKLFERYHKKVILFNTKLKSAKYEKKDHNSIETQILYKGLWRYD